VCERLGSSEVWANVAVYDKKRGLKNLLGELCHTILTRESRRQLSRCRMNPPPPAVFYTVDGR
jgi:hypothetical protein